MKDRYLRSHASEDASERDELVQALTSASALSGMAVSRTRRVVLGTSIGIEEQRRSQRKKAGVVLIACILFLTLLAPALWSSFDSFAAGGHFADLQTQTCLLGVMLFPGIVAAAIAVFMRQRAQNRGQF